MTKIALSAMAIVGGYFLMAESRMLDALVSFWLTGNVPGTSLTVSPNLMIAAFVATAWLVLFRLTALGALNALLVRRFAVRQARRQHLPKRRYNVIES